jgi:hypothetical protein
MQTQTYYEPVTCYRTSYYYEPVTSYRYSCYYDPCTCSYQQVACPQTCYRLRSQTCAVTSYLQRTCQVPVTRYQIACYYEPVTTCTTPTCCTPCSTPGVAAPTVTEPPSAAPAAPALPAAPAAPAQPGVRETPSIPPTGTESNKQDYQRILPQAQSNPLSSGATPRPAAPVPPRAAPVQQPQPAAPPTVRIDRIVSVQPTLNSGSRLEGAVVSRDEKPRPGAQMLFVSNEKQGAQRPVTADKAGQFNIELAPGTWLVYLSAGDGKLLFHSKVEVRGEGNKPVMLVSR